MSRLAVDYPECLQGIDKDHDEIMGLHADKGHLHESWFLEIPRQEFGHYNVVVINPDRATASNATKKVANLTMPLQALIRVKHNTFRPAS